MMTRKSALTRESRVSPHVLIGAFSNVIDGSSRFSQKPIASNRFVYLDAVNIVDAHDAAAVDHGGGLEIRN